MGICVSAVDAADTGFAVAAFAVASGCAGAACFYWCAPMATNHNCYHQSLDGFVTIMYWYCMYIHT